jgi:hypothetical protein
MMPKRYALASDANTLPRLSELFERYPEIVADVAEEERQVIEPLVKNELGTIPPPVKKPLVWNSEKQRRAYYATNGFGHGIPYRRTGAMARGWFIDKLIDSDSVSIIIGNRIPESIFVYGPVGVVGQRNTQQVMHNNTGWLQAEDTISFWVDAYIDGITQRLTDVIDEWLGM